MVMKYISFLRFLFLLVFMTITIVSCSKSEDDDTTSPMVIENNGEDPSEEDTDNPILTSFQRRTISYFKEIALGFEFGNASETTRKWLSAMKIYVHDGAPQVLLDELNIIIDDINALTTDDFTMEIVEDKANSNYEIFLGTAADYAILEPGLADQTEANFGLFNVSFGGGGQEIVGGTMYVDTERATEMEQKHLLREELTQSLGLAKDSSKFSDSIFQAAFSTKVVAYSTIDEELIRLLYHPEMKVGLNEDSVEDVLIQILSKN